MRYSKNNIFKNEEDIYKNFLKERGDKFVIQYDTPTFNHPSSEDLNNFSVDEHTWKVGDRYFKLAEQYYSDVSLWWVIALYNQKPTESHLKVGDIVYVPYPLESVLYYMGY